MSLNYPSKSQTTLAARKLFTIALKCYHLKRLMFSFIYLFFVISVSFITRQKGSFWLTLGKPKKSLILAKIWIISDWSHISSVCKWHTYSGAEMRVYAGRSLDRKICKYHCLLSFPLTSANTDWVTITRFQRKTQPRLWADDQTGDISNSCPPLVSKH